MARKSGVALLLGLVLAGCGSSRPTASPPVLDCGLERFVVADIFSGWHGFDRGQRSAAQGAAAAQRPLNVLALSAGGELGVFGAGFLRGWREAGAAAQPVDRGDIQIVTGVSAGALLATHAFLGKDVFLHEILPDIGRDALFSTRTLSLLWANALLDDAGKDKSQRDDVLQDEVISEVAVETKPGHFL